MRLRAVDSWVSECEATQNSIATIATRRLNPLEPFYSSIASYTTVTRDWEKRYASATSIVIGRGAGQSQATKADQTGACRDLRN